MYCSQQPLLPNAYMPCMYVECFKVEGKKIEPSKLLSGWVKARPVKLGRLTGRSLDSTGHVYSFNAGWYSEDAGLKLLFIYLLVYLLNWRDFQIRPSSVIDNFFTSIGPVGNYKLSLVSCASNFYLLLQSYQLSARLSGSKHNIIWLFQTFEKRPSPFQFYGIHDDKELYFNYQNLSICLSWFYYSYEQ